MLVLYLIYKVEVFFKLFMFMLHAEGIGSEKYFFQEKLSMH